MYIKWFHTREGRLTHLSRDHVPRPCEVLEVHRWVRLWLQGTHGLLEWCRAHSLTSGDWGLCFFTMKISLVNDVHFARKRPSMLEEEQMTNSRTAVRKEQPKWSSLMVRKTLELSCLPSHHKMRKCCLGQLNSSGEKTGWVMGRRASVPLCPASASLNTCWGWF